MTTKSYETHGNSVDGAHSESRNRSGIVFGYIRMLNVKNKDRLVNKLQKLVLDVPKLVQR